MEYGTWSRLEQLCAVTQNKDKLQGQELTTVSVGMMATRKGNSELVSHF